MLRKLILPLISFITFTAIAQQLPHIPDSITQVQTRADYLALHYWDDVDFSASFDDTPHEQFMVDFIDLIGNNASSEVISVAVDSLIVRADRYKALPAVAAYAEKYLYETDSPMLNEDLYSVFVRAMLSLEGTPYASRLRLEDTLEQIERNRPGSPLPDLEVYFDDGSVGQLAELADGLPAIVLLFDTDCESCQQTIREMTTDDRLATVLNEGRIRVIAIDLAELSGARRSQLPNWIWTKASPDTDVEDAFAMRATPSIYLVGRDGLILLKDVSYARLAQAIFH